MPDAFPSIPFEEALAALKRRGLNLAPSGHWATVWQEQHHAAFTVARSAGFDILSDIHAELVRVMAEGRTFNDFKKELTPLLQSKGWWGRATVADPDTGEVKNVQLGSVRRLRTIYDVNLRVSAAQGRWEQQQRTKGAFPYLRYVGILDSKIRPRHRQWHGTILPLDHPWWKTHYPPNGWHCRCEAVSVSADDLERYGWKPAEVAPDSGETEWVNPATGETTLVPDGIDPGFAYNPGDTDQAARAAKLAMDKLVDLPPALGAAAVADMAFAFPQVERELGEWIDGILTRAEGNDFRATKARRVVGAFSDAVLRFLAGKGLSPASAALSISDADLFHAVRTAKVNPLPKDILKRLPSLLAKPQGIFWDLQNDGLIYLFDLGGDKGKLVVLVEYKTRINRETATVNTIRTGRLVHDFSEFTNTGRYERVQ